MQLGYLRFSCAQKLNILQDAIDRIQSALIKDQLIEIESKKLALPTLKAKL